MLPQRNPLAALFLVFLAASSTSAEVISFEFSGKVGADVIDPLSNFPSIGIGDDVLGTIRYDTDLPETFGDIDPAYGFYDHQPPFDVLDIIIGDRAFKSSPLLPPTVIVANDVLDPFVDDFTDLFSVFGDVVSVSGEFDGLMTEIGIGLLSSDLDALESNALPEYFDFELFEFGSFFLNGLATSGETIEIIGSIDSLTRIGHEGRLLAGDADQDGDFDQLDLVKVSIAGKYLTGRDATWGDGDWDAEPAGFLGKPRQGDGVFNQIDIVAALKAGAYLTGPYAARIPRYLNENPLPLSVQDLRRDVMVYLDRTETLMDAINVEYVSVPEPVSMALLVLGATILCSYRSRGLHRQEATIVIGN